MARPTIHDADTARALLDAAALRLARDGPAGVGVRNVAADVGVSTRAVYAQFGSRDGLLRALFREGFAGLARELAEVTETDQPLADLRRVGDAYRASALARPHLYPAMFQALGVDPDPDAAPTADATFGALVEAVARCVDAGLVDGDPLTLGRQLWGLAHGLVLLELSGSLGDDPDSVWDQALRAIVAGHAGPALRGRPPR